MAAATAAEIQTNGGEKLFNLLIPATIGVALRAAAATYSDFFEERVEFTSSVYSFERLKDGIAMLDDGLDPFQAKNSYFPPLTLHIFRFLLKSFPTLLLPIWILFDVSTAYMASQAAQFVWKSLKKSDEETKNIGKLVFNLYAFNPITIVSTGILSLTIFQNFCFAAIFLLFVTVFFCSLKFSSIQPNVGLYWYFFVQIFEHFRSFYTNSFVILYFFMPFPITCMIRKDPILHFTIIGLLASIFFPYPTLNQVSLIFAILPLLEVYRKRKLKIKRGLKSYFQIPILLKILRNFYYCYKSAPGHFAAMSSTASILPFFQ
ncbi:hypothetical protein CRE_07905 [Caenorhabditis remanei]|uniref:Uncharacterized protein n=1 Tax=Caenorhabditis remanei TaxID=31234 RepID=E3NNJ5_CAERE|nr:hypothetical protein CRE_07905 [Caenorhabditis remanei]